MATDPSHGVAQELLPHIHLLNTYRYATTPQVSLPEIAKWLQAAPKIARDTAPFFWTYLEAPPDGSIFLEWQPLNRLGTEFASDGYIWPGNETYYVQDLGNGLTMEMFMQRSGYRPGTEQMTSHARRRFRLVPPKAPTPNAPQVDPSLWIIHYGAEAPQDRHPISAVPHDPRVHQIMNARMALQRWGQIVRKEFMLSDRVNWPQIPLPGGARQPMYPASNNQRGLPPQMAYPPHPGSGVGPPAKRARHAAGAAAAQQQMMGSVPGLEGVQDDEEDTSRGDAFDAYTPRDVSLLRYRQNHDWMEEITSSAFRMGQITFSDLGLGRKGELASLTEGIFNAQGGEAVTEVPKEPIEGKLPPGLADDFRKRVADALEAANAEMEKMKVKHEQLVAELKKNSVLNEAERGIRLAVEETGPEIWRLEGRQEEEQEMSSRPVPKARGNVEDLVAKVETTLSRQVEPMPLVRRVQDGGYQEPAPKPVLEPVPQQQATGQGDSTSTPAGVAASLSRQSSLAGAQGFEADMDMLGGTAASMMDQMHTGVSSTPTPVNNFPTPQQPAHLSAAPSAAATPANVASPQPPVQKVAGEDVVMGESDADATGAGQAAAGDDWVVVQKGEVPSASAAASRAASVAAQQGGPAAKAATPASTGADAFGGGDSNDFASLGDLDTAGDALASFGDAPVGDLGDGLDLDMEDSAFGDAFHGVSESRDQGGDTPADGGL